MALEDQAIIELLLETREGLAQLRRFEGDFKQALGAMSAAVRSGMDPASAEFQKLERRVEETGREFLQAGERGETAMRRLAAATGRENTELTELRTRLASAHTELDRFHREGTSGLSSLIKGFGGVRSAVSAIAASFATIQVSNFIRGSVDAAVEAEDALGRVQASIEATDKAAGRSLEQIKAIAKEIQDTTTFSDDDVLGLANTLLSFEGIVGRTFDRTIGVVVDLSAKTRRGLEETGQAVAKAMSLGAEGISQLRRAGVVLGEAQEEQIKLLFETGRVIEGQNALLDALEGKAKGAARALNDELGGALKNLIADWDELKEAFGTGLGKGLSAALEGVSTKTKEATESAENFGRGAGTLISWMLRIVLATQEAGGAFGDFVARLRGLQEANVNPIRVTLENLRGALFDTGVSASRMAVLFTEALTDIQAAGPIADETRDKLIGIAQVIAKRLLDEGKELPAFLRQAVEMLGALGTAAADAADPVDDLARGVVELTDDQKKLAAALGLTGEHLGKQVTDLLAVIAETQRHGKVTTEEAEIIKKALSELLTAYATIGEQAPPELLKVSAAFGALSKQQEDAAKKLRDFVTQAYKDLADKNKAMTEEQAKAAAPGIEQRGKLTERIKELEDSITLTIDEVNELDRLKNELADMGREGTAAWNQVGNAAAATGDKIEHTAAEIAEMGSLMDGTGDSLGRLHPEFERLDENVRRVQAAGKDAERTIQGLTVDFAEQTGAVRESVQIFDKAGNELAAYETGATDTAEALRGFAARQADFNLQGHLGADAAQAAAQGTEQLGEAAKTTEEKVRDLAEQMAKSAEAVKEMHGEATLAAIKKHEEAVQAVLTVYKELEACLRRIGELAA